MNKYVFGLILVGLLGIVYAHGDYEQVYSEAGMMNEQIESGGHMYGHNHDDLFSDMHEESERYWWMPCHWM